jgi:hypothetical protein
MSSESLLQRAKRALSDGIWWEPAWWQETQYYPPNATAKNSTDLAFAELRQVFDPTWFLPQVDCCPVLADPEGYSCRDAFRGVFGFFGDA